MKHKLDFIAFGLVWAFLSVIYIITKYSLHNLYTPEWAVRRIYIYVMILLSVMALLGHRIFVIFAIAGYIIGITAGELFGGFESHIGPQYLHWGWLIFIVVFLVSCIIGIIIEKRFNKS